MPANAQYDAADLKRAIASVRRGTGLREAARHFNVPPSTLHRKVESDDDDPQRQRRGPHPILGETEEDVVEWVKKMARMGFPVTMCALQQVGLKLAKLASKNGIERAEQIVSAEKWVRLFRDRHKDLVLRKAEHVSNAQASVSESDIRSFFTRIESRLAEDNLMAILREPSRIFNTDETGMALNPEGGLVVAEKGSRVVYVRGGSEKEMVTVLVTGSAAGSLAPTAMVLRRKRLPPALTNSAREGFCVLKSDRGWMTGSVFRTYLESQFVPFLVKNGIQRPVLLFLDNHRSHLTMEVTDFCESQGIVLLPLMPNATHILQPLDVAVFRPLKAIWFNTASAWRMQNGGRAMRKDEFVVLLQKAFENFESSWLINGFRKAGLSPWDPNAVDYSKICSAEGAVDDGQNESTPRERSMYDFMFDLEERLTVEQLDLFRQHDGKDWHGPARMKDLYNLWLEADRRVRGEIPSPQESEEERAPSSSESLCQEDILAVPEPYKPKRR
ncbi:uncharacterized protein LOC108864595 [Galendromus occidentalis]|uniref:Uncharacterized protein LOC108864595 n=1 Tax=Galendromus occidentalis TaxID=34638 RepID=A0AAJ7L7C7_9ACAR|nr:uncharacterized protein LOC108864595 [Galendromus occidentalis]